MIAQLDTVLGSRVIGRPIAPWRWAAAGTGTLALLLLLAVAETRWLHVALPRDSVSRVALVVLPVATTVDATLDDADWQHAFLAATRDVVGAEGSSRIAGTCIDWTDSSGHRVRGLLLINTVRGPEAADVDGIARSWAGRVGQIGNSASPPLSVMPVESMGLPYEACR